MSVFRVDNRLVHGQIIEAWLPYTGARHVFVAHDVLAQDSLHQQIMSLAMPQRVEMHFTPIHALSYNLQRYAQEITFVLFQNLYDLSASLQEIGKNIAIEYINIGNLHDSHAIKDTKKKQIAPHIFVNEEEWGILHKIHEVYPLDFRAIPSEKKRGFHELCP